MDPSGLIFLLVIDNYDLARVMTIVFFPDERDLLLGYVINIDDFRGFLIYDHVGGFYLATPEDLLYVNLRHLRFRELQEALVIFYT
jgi:hypothetical protein